LQEVRRRLVSIEGKASTFYFHQIFQLLPAWLRVDKRKSWTAYDGLNNMFNLAYTLLKFRVHSAVLRAHLEPYLGFVHSEHFGKPSLACDMMELYRYLIDSLIIDFSQALTSKDFTIKKEWVSASRLGKREVLGVEKTRMLARRLNQLFQISLILHSCFLWFAESSAFACIL
jgi:CRISPR-associated protein Cas1